MKKIKPFLAVLMAVVLSFSTVAFGEETDIAGVIADTGAYLVESVPNPQIGKTGGEWIIIGLSRSNHSAPQSYFDKYYGNLEKFVKEKNGVLHEKKYTEYSRVVLALTAIGKDPANVAGYNLLEPLGDFDKTIWQGVNGSIFALIALDSKNYDMPQCPGAKTQATRQMYIDEILAQQLADGGFALSGDEGDPDMTGMALQALSRYQSIASVKNATEKALAFLSKAQDADGGYSSGGYPAVESAVQVLVALCELDIDVNDPRFVKNDNTVLDNILAHYIKEQGFLHAKLDSNTDGISTEQCLYALAAFERMSSGKNSLYDMSDVAVSAPNTSAEENDGKNSAINSDISIKPITNAGKTFDDIKTHTNREAIEALTERGIISGMTDKEFMPERSITRGQFAAIIVNALGLTPAATNAFNDVKETDWYAPYVGTAYNYSIVSGMGKNTFAPDDTITRQEAAVMVANAAALCGMDVELSDAEIRDMLAQFPDYTSSAPWARNSLAFCYTNGILSQADYEIEPATAIKRCEVAEMVYRMLGAAKLI